SVRHHMLHPSTGDRTSQNSGHVPGKRGLGPCTVRGNSAVLSRLRRATAHEHGHGPTSVAGQRRHASYCSPDCVEQIRRRDGGNFKIPYEIIRRPYPSLALPWTFVRMLDG